MVTGGAGFIGANLARHYLDSGCRVVIYDTLERRGCVHNIQWLRKHPRSDNLEVLVGDVRFPSAKFKQQVEATDALFHMAGQVAVTTSVSDPVLDFEVNTVGTFKILEAVRQSQGKKPAIFYASTNKVYGGLEDVQICDGADRYSYRDFAEGIPENRVLDFHSPYGCSKGAADQYVRDYARIYGIKTVVFRQSCIYGYRQFGLEDQGWVAWFTISAVLGEPVTIYGDGKQVRDVLFIDDLIEAYDLAMAKIERIQGNIFNIGGGPENSLSLRELIELLRSEVNPSLSVSHADWRPADQPVYISDISKARRDLGWEPKVDWKSGVQKLIAWVEKNRSFLEKSFKVNSSDVGSKT